MYLKPMLPIILAIVSFLALYHHVIIELVQDWSSNDNYSHGFLVPFISAYLIWQNRERLSASETKPFNIGLLLLLMSLFFFIASYIGAELFTMRFSMLLVLWSLTVLFFGWSITRSVSLPIAYLLFMIPLPAIIWNKIAFPLKLFATQMAVWLVKFINITVYSEGNVIYLSNTTLEVVDACSGLRSLTSLLALSAAFSLITDHIRIKKLILFLSAVPLAILLNIFRLSTTAVMAKYWGPETAQGFLHEASGIIVFVIALTLLFFFNRLLSWSPGRTQAQD